MSADSGADPLGAPPKVALYTGEQLKSYAFGDGHPFGPDRLDAFLSELDRHDRCTAVRVRAPVQASEDMLAWFHTAGHIARVRRLSAAGEGFLDCGDTPAFRGIYEAAGWVVGTTWDACCRLMRAEHRRVFIPIAGLHHARRDAAAGFCAFNDCGVAIEGLKREFGCRRIAYVDIDAHHGDGVYYGFEADPAVWIADIHEDGRFLYPGTGSADETGSAEAAGTKLNLPLPPHAGDVEFLRAWSRVEELLHAARPELILFQCGADSIAGDPITHLRLTPAAHAHAARRLCAIADDYSEGRLLAMGGGGYNRSNLARAWSAVLSCLTDTETDGA